MKSGWIIFLLFVTVWVYFGVHYKRKGASKSWLSVLAGPVLKAKMGSVSRQKAMHRSNRMKSIV